MVEQVSDPFTVDLRRLTVLRELQRRGSLARTAEALHLTPSAVSQQIAALAREAGVPLTEKEGRGVRLTGQARVLLAHADVIAAQLERARADLEAYGEGGRGSVTIGCLASGILGLLPDVLRALAERLPRVRVDVVESEPPDLFTALDAGQVDVAVAVHFAAAPPHTDVRYRRTELFTDVMDVAVPAGHRLAGRDRVSLRELAAEPWIVGDARSCVGAVARSVCAAAGFTPDIRHAVDDWSALAALVEAGRGVALIPRLVRPAYAHRDLALLTTKDGPPPSRHLFAAVRTGAETDPVLATVLEQLRLSGLELSGRV
ncbi:DNA-binding transcriptional LysR family regulator [Streptomyces sp. SAI-208]|uniref:LysR family transcriptional regulator n=1 Tax=unclassified Streptomyces TaxID=2593676 RepID=UPI0024753213|nr:MULTISPECIES: LysR family transcriptional regulator [unclassified Streptomyces]MDH6518911.1 DNA-binding transcriptional LysR family regulator [Streptomyces sp. SAI-090]MDH6584832.1 DNA-binding transcriptional LysR family regulator [Streptomyces sp. SAI-133]MDH6609757.1 DNA-binding transcriptional LysR family regulator [Streptomyces sp. SAI-208]MDH6616995.1 DNA-binding transcriptional LysR family regulator [Streptomyces sp. SAI-135]